MSSRQRGHSSGYWRPRWFSGMGLLGLLVILLLVVGLIQHLPAWRADLTEDRLYTLTSGTRTILEKLDGSIELELFYSDKASEELPQLRDYARRVRELLEEYSLVSGGKLVLTQTDPEPFSEAEDRAAEYGLQGVPVSVGGDTVYFGLVGRAGEGGAERQEVIAFFNPEREAFLEYDISQLVYRLADDNPTVVGVLTGVSALGGFDFARRQPGEPWLVIEQLRKIATVRQLDMELERVDEDVDVLMVIHPRNLSAKTRYAVDQFVLAGGRALVFVDPHFEMAAGGMMATPAANASALPDLFRVWGVDYDASQVVADAKWAMRLPSGDNDLPLPHVGILGLQGEALQREDITISNLETINVAMAGALSGIEGASTRFVPLLRSSDLAMTMDAGQFVGVRDHGQLLKAFAPQGGPFTLAARVQGPAKSAFPEGRPREESESGTGDNAEGNDVESTESEAKPEPGHLRESQGDINVIIVADTDILTDRLWVRVSDFFGQRVAAPWANNGDFIANAVENLGGSSDLISVRARGQYSRPFERVEALQLKAAQRFREQEQLLLQKLENLEAKIQQLSQDEAGQTVLTLSAEQEAEIQAFEREKLQIRKELRQVQHQLNKDIEALERKVKLVNIALVPGILTLAMVVLAVARTRRRR